MLILDTVPNSIAVDPDHQGKGIGTMLALWGVEQAMKEGRDVYLLASSAGALLYKKLGFTEIYGTEIMGERQFAMAKTRTPIVVQSAEP